MTKEWNETPRAVRFFGRTDGESLPGRVFFNWSGAGFEFSMSGTAAYARLHTADHGELPVPPVGSRAWVGVYVDGGTELSARLRLDSPDDWYTLAQGLPDGPHTVRVVKLSECGYGRAALSEVRTLGAAPPRPTAPRPRRLEFIGDSITCGYGNECSNESPAFVTREQNAGRTYAAFLGRMLDAETHLVCASGNGLYHDYGCNAVNLMPELYRYTDKLLAGHLGREPRLWDTARFPPHLVVIKLGANDSRYCDGFDLEDEAARTDALKERRRHAFAERLAAFLDQVREANPGVPILYVTETGTILRDTILETLETYRANHPEARLEPYVLEGKRPWEGAGANGHWSTTTHRRAALVLEPVIRALCGWPREE